MEEQDLFIAYHGTYNGDGSLSKAKELFYYLESKGIKCYFFPNEKNDYFANTPVAVKNSHKFILVCNPSLQRKSDGSIQSNGVYQEVTTFWNCIYEGKRNRGDARVYAYDGMTMEDANELHIAFQGVAHIQEGQNVENSFEEVYRWVLGNEQSVAYNGNIDTHAAPEILKDTSNELKTVYVRRSMMNKNWNLRKMISVAGKIECLGISNNELTLKMDASILLDALNRGAHIELVFLDPKSKFTRFREKEEGQVKNTIKNNTNTTLSYAIRLKNKNEYNVVFDNLKIYTYDRLPRMNMIIIDETHMLLQYYANSIPGASNPCFYIKKQFENQIFDFYYNQYKKIRAEGKEHV